MLRPNWKETLGTAVLAHGGCVLTCLGTGMASAQQCEVAPVVGGPLSYFWGQAMVVVPGILIVWLYMRCTSAKLRSLALVSLTIALLFPASMPIAAFSLQGMFLVQLTLILLSRLRNSALPAPCCQALSS